MHNCPLFTVHCLNLTLKKKKKKEDKSRLEKIGKKGVGVLRRKWLFWHNVRKMTSKETEWNTTQTLKTEFDGLLNVHSCCFRAPKTPTSKHSNSCMPTAISTFTGGQACFWLNEWEREREREREVGKVGGGREREDAKYQSLYFWLFLHVYFSRLNWMSRVWSFFFFCSLIKIL